MVLLQYYNPWVSLIGTLLCVVVMFLMDWITALITFICVCVLYMYISYRKPGWEICLVSSISHVA